MAVSRLGSTLWRQSRVGCSLLQSLALSPQKSQACDSISHPEIHQPLGDGSPCLVDSSSQGRVLQPSSFDSFTRLGEATRRKQGGAMEMETAAINRYEEEEKKQSRYLLLSFATPVSPICSPTISISPDLRTVSLTDISHLSPSTASASFSFTFGLSCSLHRSTLISLPPTLLSLSSCASIRTEVPHGNHTLHLYQSLPF